MAQHSYSRGSNGEVLEKSVQSLGDAFDASQLGMPVSSSIQFSSRKAALLDPLALKSNNDGLSFVTVPDLLHRCLKLQQRVRHVSRDFPMRVVAHSS